MANRRVSRTVALLRYHRPSQFAWRLYRILQRSIRKRLPERFVFQPRQQLATWKPGAKLAFQAIADQRLNLWPGRTQHAAEMTTGRFRFLNQTRDLLLDAADGTPRIDWNPQAPRLWRFHLQCQESLLELANQCGCEAAYGIIQSWLSEPRHQSPIRDPDAWHPFCISRRLPVWLSLAATHDPPAELAEDFWQSVTDQIDWLRRNAERDLGGNHLLENLTALYLAECFLEFPAQAKLPSVERGLLSQLDEQVLSSGEHYERTPTYHALMMICVMQCAEAAEFADSTALPRFQSVASRMLQFAKWIQQPDGQFPLLSDSAKDETPNLPKLFAWAETHPLPESIADPTIDYWASRTPNGDRILFDTGPLACDHLPAHGHADLLQVVANVRGRDAIVDTGNYEYESTELRLRCRQTAAHNVLQLGSKQQCDLWSSFRMGRRGHVLWQRRGQEDGFSWCAAAHDGFGSPVCRIVIAHESAWAVIDWFNRDHGKGLATSRLHWHPDWSLTLDESENVVSASCGGHPQASVSIKCLGEGIRPSIEPGLYCPNFGERFDNQVLCVASHSPSCQWLGMHINLPDDGPKSIPAIEPINGKLSITMTNNRKLVFSFDSQVIVAHK